MSGARMRVPDWRTRLVRWARRQERRPFIWGQTDCGSLARAALLEMFGADVVPHIPRYSSWAEAVRASAVVHAHGGFDGILRALGGQIVPLAFLRTGDIVVRPEATEDVGGHSLLVCADPPMCLVSTRQYGVRWGVPTDGTVWSLWEVAHNG